MLSHTALDMVPRINCQQITALNGLYTALASSSPAHTVVYFEGNYSRGNRMWLLCFAQHCDLKTVYP